MPTPSQNEAHAENSEHFSWEESEDRFRAIVESAPSGIIVADKNSQILMVNQKSEQMFGYSRDEFLTLTVESLVPDQMRESHKGYRKNYHHKPEGRAMGVGRDLFALRKDGTEFPVEIGLAPLPTKTETLVLSSILDISERKRHEQELRLYSEKLEFQAEILKNVHDAIFFVNNEGVVLDWNEGATRIFGIPSSDAIGKTLQELCPHKGHHPFSDRIIPAVKENGVTEQVVQCHTEDERNIFIHAKATAMSQNNREGYVICATDITKQKKLESELVRASEEEQRRIGQDIHDDLCSQLSGIGCLTKVLQQQLSDHQKKEAEMMAEISEMISAAGTKARDIAKGLVPSVLENRGLADALRDLAKKNRALFGVNCIATVVTTPLIDNISLETSTQLYRIAQEGVNNAVKHSDADVIHIELIEEQGRVELTIKDDGKGMTGDFISAGMGMLTMRRRSEIIHAEFDIHATPGEGTTIRCSIPSWSL